jgi:hypothetical protein
MVYLQTHFSHAGVHFQKKFSQTNFITQVTQLF